MNALCRMMLLLAALAAWPAAAANPLEEVRVTATRIPSDVLELPFAAARVDGEAVQRGRQQLGLDEALASQPGLFFQNRYNFAQDLRIAIRGFGARANFGIRGIRIFADDIPQTLPDGQGSVDAIDLGSVGSIEIIRGPFAAVYGASSGGVILIRSEDGPKPPAISGRYSAGPYGYRQWQLKAGGQAGPSAAPDGNAPGGGLNWLANLSATRLDGYRDHATFESRLFNSKWRYQWASGDSLTLIANAVDSPRADDPGALNAREVATDRRQAAPRNLLFDAGEELDQQSLGAAYRRGWGKGDVLLRAYYQQRDFSNRLPFDVNSNGQGGSVVLDRDFGGAGVQYSRDARWADRDHRLVAGIDYDAQRDHRRRYANEQGIIGVLTTDQDEDVTTTALFVQDVIEFGAAAALTLGARLDDVDYRVADRTANQGSAQRSFREFSPMAGFSWGLRDTLRLYGNVSTSFDPPTTTELANPYGPTGFNPDLEPQTATNFEVGLKGRPGRLGYELALFRIEVRDEIVPFELEGSGQSFFENAGRSRHEGLEAALRIELLPGLNASLAYTWSDFRFVSFSSPGGERFDGNRIPGIPEHQVSAGLDWNHSTGFFAGWDLLYVGPFFADNANAVEVGDYVVSNLRAGFRWQAKRWAFEPFLGVNNLFDELYSSNVRLNAAFGRYYEPAPERNVYGGLEFRYGFP